MSYTWMTREPWDVYHRKREMYVTSHALSDFRRCPQLYHRKRTGLVSDEDRTEYLVGRAAHTLILEGRQAFDDAFQVATGPINPKTGKPYGRTTKAFKDWADSQGMDVLTDGQAAVIEYMAASVRSHGVAADLLTEGWAERVVRCYYCGHPCQARIDWYTPNHEIVDLKTAATLDEFEDMARAYDYPHQLAFYRALVTEASGHTPECYIVAVEKREPYRCGVWLLDDAILADATRDNERALRELDHCLEVGDWFTRFEELRTLK